MNLELSDAQMQQIMSTAVLNALNSQTREDMITQAIVHLMTPKKPDYGRGDPVSPLQEAFNRALVRTAEETIKAMMDDEASPLRGSVMNTIRQGVEAFMDADKEKLVRKITGSIETGLCNASDNY